MRQADQLSTNDEVIIADEADPQSKGMLLAAQQNADRAPFFIVERDGKAAEIYTLYFKFGKEVLNAQTDEADELQEIMNENPDLDFL